MGLVGGGERAARELLVGLVNALTVGVGCRAADVLAVGQPPFGLGELLQPEQPGLEGVVVWEPGGVGAGVPQSDLGCDVTVLDRAGDQAPRAADDEPGQRAAQP